MTSEARGTIEPIANLSLDRRRLTLLVIGAGFGESVLIALPGSEGWVVVDGAAPSGNPPAVELLRRYWSRDSTVELLLLTHPHADHHSGFIELLDDRRIGPSVKRIGCVSHYLGVVHGHVLGREVEAAFQGVDVDDPEARKELGRARSVLERIGSEWIRQPARRWEAVRGAALSFGDDVALRVLGPDREHVSAFFTAPGLARRILEQANDLSVVLELRFGRTGLLLGADLPNERNGRRVECGWSHLCSTVTGLHEHAGYKVADHASREAIHPDVVRPHGRARVWATTPYNKGQTLPRFEEGEGVSLLQACERELLLTALPVGFRDQRPMPERVRRAEIERASFVGRGPLGRLAPVVWGGPPVKSPPAECVWAIQLDDQGNVTNRHRGAAAVAVV